MLTQEQIKNLKPGDPLIANVSLKRINEDGDIWATAPGCSVGWFTPDRVSLPSEHGTSVPTPKHDPTRLFKKGDKVRVAEWNGRKDSRNGMEATVLSNEHGCFVDIECMIKEVKAELTYPACLLELVTPVEELDPYFVIKGDLINGWDVCKQKNENICCTVATFTQGHPNAKAAAEAERDRLNAEYRKEQNHG